MSVLRTAAGNGWNWKTAVLKLPSFELAVLTPVLLSVGAAHLGHELHLPPFEKQ
jgi:hypothetical protein